MSVSSFRLPPRDLVDERQLARQISSVLTNVMKGRTNNVIDVTVNISQATTTVTDDRIGVNTVAIAIPTNSDSETALIWPYRDFTTPLNGSMTLNHTNSGTTKTYKIILVG
jgi:hypothetical protein